MRDQKLEDAVRSLRAEEPREEVLRDTARRVFRNVFDAAYISDPVGRIKGCGDFEALIPAYLERSLTPARTALLEDHLHSCVACRRVLNEQRGAAAGILPMKRTEPKPKPGAWMKWGLAGALAAGLVLGVTGVWNGLLPGRNGVRVKVLSVEGALYRINKFGTNLVTAGTLINNADELRTARGSRAIFQLLNGAKVEMCERSDVSLSRGFRETSVEVERGRVIVAPVSSSEKAFLLAVGDMRVPVKNAVVAADRGTKGSRIALAKGSTRIERNGRAYEIHAGQQFAGYHLQNASFENDFAWSANASEYRALLDELKSVQQDIRAIPSPSLRYSSVLTPYLPANTVIYAAIPNLGGTIQQAKQIFEQHLSESAVLREWWQHQAASRSGELDHVLDQISAVSSYLGDEIVLAIPSSGPHQYGSPILLAEAAKPGLEDYVNHNLPQNAAHSLGFFTNGKIVAASPDNKTMDQLRTTLMTPANAFASTPFFQRIEQSYNAGAQYLLAVDMEQMVANSVHSAREIPTGFDHAQYLVLQRRDVSNSNVETRAALSFKGDREGVASWLGAPGPMGSLDFVSPDAFVAGSIVMKNPLTIVQEFINYAGQKNPDDEKQLDDMEQHLGVKVTDDIAALFGGDATLAIDGQLLPVPSWKFAIEAYNPDRINSTIKTLVDHFNQQASRNAGKLSWSAEQANGRTFYALRSDKSSAFVVYYTFVDGFLLAGPEEQLLLQAIQNRENGYTLANSQAFKDQLPLDNYVNCSALLWHNPGKNVQEAAKQFASQPQGSLLQLLANSGAGLICVYGEPDRIVAATRTDFLGFNLNTLLGLGTGAPLPQLLTPPSPPSVKNGAQKI